MKTKEKLIKDILSSADIHHNISINWSKMPDYTETDGFDWNNEAEWLVNDFIDNMKYEKINDKGNRNLCGCNKVICTKADFKKDNGYNGRHFINNKWYYWVLDGAACAATRAACW